jgi:hypothetical protein
MVPPPVRQHSSTISFPSNAQPVANMRLELKPVTYNFNKSHVSIVEVRVSNTVKNIVADK